MQFLKSTFDAVIARHPLPGRDGMSLPSPYDPSDAIHAAAYLLCDNGARDSKDIYTAIWNYNHDSNYVTRVLEIAHQYATPGKPGEPEEGTPPQAQPAPAGVGGSFLGLLAEGFSNTYHPSATALPSQVTPRATGALITPVRLAALGPNAETHAAASPPTSNLTTPGRHGRAWLGQARGRHLASASATSPDRAAVIPAPGHRQKGTTHACTDRPHPHPTRWPRP